MTNRFQASNNHQRTRARELLCMRGVREVRLPIEQPIQLKWPNLRERVILST